MFPGQHDFVLTHSINKCFKVLLEFALTGFYFKVYSLYTFFKDKRLHEDPLDGVVVTLFSGQMGCWEGEV